MKQEHTNSRSHIMGPKSKRRMYSLEAYFCGCLVTRSIYKQVATIASDAGFLQHADTLAYNQGRTCTDHCVPRLDRARNRLVGGNHLDGPGRSGGLFEPLKRLLEHQYAATEKRHSEL